MSRAIEEFIDKMSPSETRIALQRLLDEERKATISLALSVASLLEAQMRTIKRPDLEASATFIRQQLSAARK